MDDGTGIGWGRVLRNRENYQDTWRRQMIGLMDGLIGWIGWTVGWRD